MSTIVKRVKAETFGETKYAWRRLKLLLAEGLVLSVAKRGYGAKYANDVLCTAQAIEEFREDYYPAPERGSK